MTKIIQITDTHIVPDGGLCYGKVDTAAALAETAATLTQRLPEIGPVDLVLVTGDLTEHGQHAEYTRFKHILAGLELPLLAVPGNHDNRDAFRKAFAQNDWIPAEGPINWIRDLEAFAVIGLDTLVSGSAHGEIAPATAEFLKRQLAALGGKPVLIGFHHPPFTVGIEAMDRQNLTNANVLAEAICDYEGEVQLVCGHLHRTISGLFGGRLCQVAPGPSHAVTLDQRHAAENSLTVEPGGLMLHEWRGGRFLSHLLPVGAFDGPYPFAGVF